MHCLFGRFAVATATTVLFTATSALADYSTCMTHCMTQHDFEYCHAICANRVDDPTNVPAALDEHCKLMEEEQFDLIRDFFEAHYDEDWPAISQSDEDTTVFDVEWLIPDEECRGVIKVTGDCEVVRHKKFHCEWTGWTQEQEATDLAERALKEIYDESESAIRALIRSFEVKYPDWAAWWEDRQWRNLPWELVNIDPGSVSDVESQYTFVVTYQRSNETIWGEVKPVLRCVETWTVYLPGYRIEREPDQTEACHWL